MKSVEEQITEINKLRKYYTIKKQCRRLSAAATALSVMIIGLVIYAPMVPGQIDTEYSALFGATILGPEAGGYVIVGLLAFALGIIVTLLIQKKKNLDKS